MNTEQLTNESGRFAVEYRLQERERFLRTLIGNLPGVVYRCRTDERFTSEFISDGCLELTGYTADELTQVRAATWDNIIHAEDREHVRAEIKRSMNENTALIASPLQIAYRIVHRDGSVKHVRDRFRFINDAGGKIAASASANRKRVIVCLRKICMTSFVCTNRTGVTFMCRRRRSRFSDIRRTNLSELHRMIIYTREKSSASATTRTRGF